MRRVSQFEVRALKQQSEKPPKKVANVLIGSAFDSNRVRDYRFKAGFGSSPVKLIASNPSTSMSLARDYILDPSHVFVHSPRMYARLIGAATNRDKQWIGKPRTLLALVIKRLLLGAGLEFSGIVRCAMKRINCAPAAKQVIS